MSPRRPPLELLFVELHEEPALPDVGACVARCASLKIANIMVPDTLYGLVIGYFKDLKFALVTS